MASSLLMVHGRNDTAAFIDGVCASVLKGSFCNLSVTSSAVNEVLLRLAGGGETSSSWAFFTWAQASLPHFQHSLLPHWTMLHILTKTKGLRAARRFLENSPLMAALSSQMVLTSLLCAHQVFDESSKILSWVVFLFARSKPPSDAINVFHQMKKAGFVPDAHACSALLSSLAKKKLTSTAWKLFDEMLSSGTILNAHVFNSMIHVCYKSGNAAMAEKLLEQMRMKGLTPDLFSYNTLIALYSKNAMHYEALGVQERMEKEGIFPDIVTYNSIIHGFCREGRMREAWRIFKDIKNATPNHITFTTLVDGFCRVNDLREALRVREEMERRGLFPGVVTYNSIIRKLCEEGKSKNLNDLLNEMHERKIEPDNITCNTLINSYCKKGDMEKAWKLRNKMLESGLSLDHFTFKALILGFCKVQRVHEAKEVFFDMLDAGLSPNYNTLSWIVVGYCEQNNEDEALRILDELNRKGICDISVHRSLVRIFCKRGLVNFAHRVFLEMQGKGLVGDSLIHLNLAYGYFSEGKHLEATEFLNLMVKKDLRITAKIYKFVCDSFASDFRTMEILWSIASEKGLVSKNTYKLMQQNETNFKRRRMHRTVEKKHWHTFGA